MRAKLLALLLILVAIMLIASPANAAGVVNVCDEPHLLAALAGGGIVTFRCSETILLTNTITVVVDTALDGSGQNVTISGNDVVGVFRLNSHATLDLDNLTIINGHAVYGNGGGIDNDRGTVIVRNSTFSGNTGALDAADDAICEAAPVNGLDQRGVIRPQGAHCDIGAVEQEPYPVPDAYKIWLAAVHAQRQ